MLRFISGLALSLLASLYSPLTQAAKPLWEAGPGVGLLSLPDYRGSDQRHFYALPFPYFVYRGERLSVDRQGIRAKLFDSDRFHLDASFTGNFSLRSADNRARAGMPTLYPVLEVGPELVYTLNRAHHPRETQFDFRLATRAAFSLGANRITQRGWTASPYFRISNQDVFGSGFDLTATLGLLYGNAKYHNYLYSVDSEFANGARAAYRAPGGYAGALSQIAAGRRYGNFWIGAYLRFDTLNGASFGASPLVKTGQYTAAGLAFSWVIAASSQPGSDRD